MNKISISNSKLFLLISYAFLLVSCGEAYFPIELNLSSRSERIESQENIDIKLVPLTKKTISRANRVPYERSVIDGTDLSKAAILIPAKIALREKLPKKNEPGPYIIGYGDVISFGFRALGDDKFFDRKLFVASDGSVDVIGVGRVAAQGLTISQLRDEVQDLISRGDRPFDFDLYVTGFNSKRIYLSGDGLVPVGIPYTNLPIFLEDVLSSVLGSRPLPTPNAKISIERNGERFVMSLDTIRKSSKNKIRIFPEDKIFVSNINYKVESVTVVGETGNQSMFSISADQRPTLSNTILGNPVLNNVTSDFSQIYVLRNSKKGFTAYHLDITNPVRISLANRFEMRPDDIVFVATQPLSLYSRTLSQILGSTGLTLQARDTIRTEIGN